jgi:hypothetical protein
MRYLSPYQCVEARTNYTAFFKIHSATPLEEIEADIKEVETEIIRMINEVIE